MTTQPLQSYPISIDDTVTSCAEALRKIGQIRQADQIEWNQLSNRFLSGRSVAKVPSSSTDITGNVVGDFNVTPTYAYFCVDNAGTAEWVRIAVSTF